MIKLIRTDFKHPDFMSLVNYLDKELAVRDGDDTAFYSQYNGIEDIKYAVVAYWDNKPVGCGAIKHFDDDSVEIKRMFTLEESRGKGIASLILRDLEVWTKELNYKKCVLETGKRNPEAVALYTKKGYSRIPNYDPYIGVDNSLCFEKIVS